MDKIKLYHNESSLYLLNYKIQDCAVYIKRDDTLDYAFGGNKVRLFEYIAEVIRQSRAEKVITYGSAYSNYVRVAAAVCAKLKVGCDIILLDEEIGALSGGVICRCCSIIMQNWCIVR